MRRSYRKEEIADLLSVWAGQYFSIPSEGKVWCLALKTGSEELHTASKVTCLSAKSTVATPLPPLSGISFRCLVADKQIENSQSEILQLKWFPREKETIQI